MSLLLNVGQKGLVDGLLVLNAVLGGLLLLLRLLVRFACGASEAAYLGLLALLEESILSGLVCGLVLGEVALLRGLLQDTLINTSDVDGGGGSDDIAGVYAAQGNAVNLEGTGDEEDTLGQVLEDNDALATEATSEEDDDGTGLEGSTGLSRASSLTGLESMLAMVHCVRLAACRSSGLVALASCSRRALAAAMRPCPPLLQPSCSSHAAVSANVPSWGRRRPQQGSTCWPSASGAVSTSRPWRTSGSWVWCPPFRIAGVVSEP